MNTIKSIVTIALLWTALSGCQDFLNEEPLATIEANSFYANETEVRQGLIGVYDILGLERMYDTHFLRLASGGSDNVVGNTGALQVVEYTYGPDDAIFREAWGALYDGINRANVLIANAPNAEGIEPEVLDRYIAEARFVRALCYFNLVNLFGGVPVVTEPLAPQDLKIARNSVSEVYDLIEQDLEAGIAALPLESQLENTQLGRATQGAAQGLLAKAHLHQEEWAEAAARAQEVIASGEYTLLDNYRDIFLLENENNAEIIFRVVFSPAGPQGWGDANEGSQFSQWYRPICLGGWGSPFPTEELIEAFEPGDERYKGTVIEEGDLLVEPGFKIVTPDYQLQEGETVDESISPFTCDGWSKWWLKDGTIQADQMPLDFIVLRLADVILVRAEALAEQGLIAEATEELNKVRVRAGLAPIAPGSQAALIDAVRQERRVELAIEGTRVYDLRRWGTIIEALEAVDKSPVAGRDDLYPIPQVEIDLHEGALEQNPGWP